MLKWVILGAVVLVVIVLVIKIIKTMLKVEKESNQDKKPEQIKEEEYKPEEVPIDMRSSSAGIVTDMSSKVTAEDGKAEYEFDTSSGFSDHTDDEFFDYSAHMHGRKGRRRQPKPDFDLDGEFADEFEYQPSNFDYLNPRRYKNNDKKPINTELNELSTELKVLMLSDIFDRKFFD